MELIGTVLKCEVITLSPHCSQASVHYILGEHQSSTEQSFMYYLLLVENHS
uniref:Uncharacterized protein n=1 Tax=Octopus bimaculoides TaxID=37653 RepID=A0A0L8ICS9_OCTBM